MGKLLKFSEYFNENQIFGAVLFFIGVVLLTWLAKVERKQLIKMRDPKLKWSYIDAEGKRQDEVRHRRRRSTIVTLIGGGLALYGLIDFLVNFK